MQPTSTKSQTAQCFQQAKHDKRTSLFDSGRWGT